MNILEDLGLEKSANINITNNNNNNNDTNNKITTTTLCHKSNARSKTTSSRSLGRESKSKEKVTLKLPQMWRGVKLDLFCNGKNKDGSDMMKLNVGVIRHDNGEIVPLQASLNSSWDSGVRRSVDTREWRESNHWIKMKMHKRELEYVYNIRASKIGLKQKKGGTEMVAFVYKHQDTWCVDIGRDGVIYNFELTDEVNEKQSTGNMIATAYAGARATRLIKPQELGI